MLKTGFLNSRHTTCPYKQRKAFTKLNSTWAWKYYVYLCLAKYYNKIKIIGIFILVVDHILCSAELSMEKV